MSDTRTYAEKRKALRMRERLIELLGELPCDGSEELGNCPSRKHGMCAEIRKIDYCALQRLADHLIANGVTVTVKKPPTDLTGKCGSCAYAKVEPKKFGGLDCYVRCTNPEHLAKYCRGIDRSLRQRTNPDCKQYKQKEGAENEICTD